MNVRELRDCLTVFPDDLLVAISDAFGYYGVNWVHREDELTDRDTGRLVDIVVIGG